MPQLKSLPTLTDLQEYVAELEDERGFAHQDVLAKCLLLGEEVGELFKAIRRERKLNIDPRSKVGEASGELADIVILLCAIGNRLGINLEQSFRQKERANRERTWTVQA